MATRLVATLRAHLARWRFRRAASPGGVEHVALGTFCHAAAALRDAGLRRWSGPFDWIFSTPAMLAACLDDDGAALFDPAALDSVPAGRVAAGAKRQARHPAFESRFGLPTLFNHHDPASSERDRAALGRARARLSAALASGRPIVFYMLSEVHWPAAEIDAVAAALARRSAGTRLVVLTVLGGSSGDAAAETVRQVGTCPVVEIELRTRTRSGGTRFRDPADDARLAAVLTDVAARVGAT